MASFDRLSLTGESAQSFMDIRAPGSPGLSKWAATDAIIKMSKELDFEKLDAIRQSLKDFDQNG